MRVKALVSWNDPVREVPMFRIQNIGHWRRVRLGSHGEDVQLVELDDPGQEVPRERSESTVIEEMVVREMETKHILQEHVTHQRFR